MANYFDHLLSLDTPTYTVVQIANRLEPSTVFWAFHTIQPSSFDCRYMPVAKIYKTNLCDGVQISIFWQFFASCIFSEPRAAHFRHAF